MSFNRKYTHLFFDLDNTLWDFDHNARLAMRDTVEKLKLNKEIPDFDTFYTYYEEVNHQLWEAYRKQEVQKKELITRRFSETLNHFKIGNIDPLDMNELYLRQMANQTTLVEGAPEILRELKQRNFKLQIITNGFREVQLNKLKNSGIAHFFDHVFISEDLNYPKPDIRIFQHAIRSSNAKKEKSIMIGDNWETDIVGARNFGIDQIYFEKKQQTAPSPLICPPVTLKSNTLPKLHPSQKTFCIEKLTNILRFV
jgi:putative hydrolase of the HAD superfamily